MFLEIPVPTDTTDHSFIIWMVSLVFGVLFMIVFAVVAWIVNKVLILWEAHITSKETRKTDIRDFNELKDSVTKLDASVKHLDGTIKTQDHSKAVINHEAMELLHEIKDELKKVMS